VRISRDIFGNYPLEPIRIGSINKGGQGERIYHELGHAITLSAYGGGIGAKTGVYIINDKIRKLAPRECARLQGYPDSFMIDLSDSQAYKQFGNSVPINVLKAILKEIQMVLTQNQVYALC
jgi:DNA (cytosine-5)-methyltransferase 1